ncbi:T9SS type A sorting domain-containing protein, partial [bacterium]|nr:T9SS type A sorting domain-containing protein [bacterium]
LCKILNYDEDWEFSLNICDADGDTPLGIHYSVEPQALSPDQTLPIPAPELISPKNTFMTNNRYPIFSWKTPVLTNNPVQDWHFQIDLAKSPDFSNPEIQIDSRDNSIGFMPAMPLHSADATVRFQMQQPLADGVWWWRVKAWDGTTFSEVTPGRKLTIDSLPPRILDISAQQIQLFSRWQGPVPTSKLAIQLTYSEEYADKVRIELIGSNQKPLNLKLTSGQEQHLTTSMAMMGIIGNYSFVKATLYDLLGHQTIDSVGVTLGWIRQLGGIAQSPDTVADGSFTVSWITANLSPQNVKNFDVKFKVDDGPWQIWLEKYPAYSAEFHNAIPGHRYQFETAVREKNGQREDFSGIAESQTIVLSEVSTAMPLDFLLSANYPNPFNSATQFEFSIPQAERVSILIFNAAGKLVQTLFQNHRFEAGQHKFSWDTASKSGAIPSGVYFCRFHAGPFTTVRRMTLVK